MSTDRKTTRFSVPPRALKAMAAVTGILAACAAVMGGCGEDAAVVGGSCAAGYTECNNTCVDLTSDPNNCGACGNQCAAGVACVGGSCGGVLDGSPDGRLDGSPDVPYDNPLGEGSFREGSTDADAAADVPVADVPVTDSPVDSPVDSPTDTPTTDSPNADACTPPYDTPQHCGDCFTACTGVNDLCVANDAGSYVCAPLCDADAGLTNCSGTCVDLQNDSFNCGVCGKICPSNICVAGVCQGATPGNVVVIGHDYFSFIPGSAQSRVVSNAVLLASPTTLRVFSFEHYANASAVVAVKSILATAAAGMNRTLSYTVSVNDSDVPNMLTATTEDVLLVYDQPSAPAGTLGTIGTQWAPTLATFLSKGGVVVVLDGADGTGEMPAFATNGGLLNVTAHATLPLGTQVTVIAPGDAVGLGVISPYAVTPDSARFACDPPSSTIAYVVFDPADNQPVVVHRIVP